MPLTPGTQLGPYEITAALGAGGMGEVYRARDTRLERTVAIKVLPEHLSSDPARRQRFEREAKTISSLNHPHICTLHDIGHQSGIDFLVMEYLEGETLAARLEKGPLPTPDVLRYGVEIADALDKAHRQGVIHRDLKPGNIVLTKAGAKLLDFGLAKPAAPLVGGVTLTAAPASQMTQEGMVVGTLQYMSPEQVEGKELDGRSDIFSLGTVLYEMLTGKRAFEGKSQLSVASAILEKEPAPISVVKPTTPPTLDRAVKKCLAKMPDERWQTASDLASELKWIGESGPSVSTPLPVIGRLRKRERLAWMTAAAGIALVTAVSFAAGYFSRRAAPAYPIRSFIPAPENASFFFAGDAGGPPVLSQDGKNLAFVAAEAGGVQRIYVRPLGSPEARALAGTDNGWAPFWSPDGRKLGFFTDGKLKIVDIQGGAPVSLADAPNGRGGSWSPDGTIVFTPHTHSSLYRVPASGGAAVAVTRLDESKHTSHRWPWLLPDGKHFLYLAIHHEHVENEGIYFASLDGKENVRLRAASTNPQYAAGLLLYVRDGELVGQALDPSTGKLHEEEQQVASGVAEDTSTWRAAFAVSTNGLLAFCGGAHAQTQLAWYDRAGKQLGSLGPQAEYSNPSLSPDGTRLAVGRMDPQAKTRDLWVFDLKRGTSSRLTFDPADDLNPVWTQDGSRIFFSSDRKGQRDIYEKPVNGIGGESLVLESKQGKSIDDVSPDEKYLIYDTAGGALNQLWISPLFGERKPLPFVQEKFRATHGQFSPNGHFIAYATNETGQSEVYVQTFPEQHGKWQISTDGGAEPTWRHDGKELFYITQSKLMVVEVNTDASSFQAGIPKPLFQIPLLMSSGRNRYVVTADGQRFLFNTFSPGSEGSMINVVVNWPAGLRK